MRSFSCTFQITALVALTRIHNKLQLLKPWIVVVLCALAEAGQRSCDETFVVNGWDPSANFRRGKRAQRLGRSGA